MAATLFQSAPLPFCVGSEDLKQEVLLDDPFCADAQWPLKSKAASMHTERCYTVLGRDHLLHNHSTVSNALKNTFTTSFIPRLLPGDVNLDSWQRTHPELWTSDDVLNLIYFIAMKSTGIEVSNLCGERFQNVGGAELCKMTEDDFVFRDPVYGSLLYACIQDLIQKSEFLPPEDLSSCKQEVEEPPFIQVHTEIPITVEEMTFEDVDPFEEMGRNLVNMLGATYDIDGCGEFLSISGASHTSPAAVPDSFLDIESATGDDAVIYEDGYSQLRSLLPSKHPHYSPLLRQRQPPQPNHRHQEYSLLPDLTSLADSSSASDRHYKGAPWPSTRVMTSGSGDRRAAAAVAGATGLKRSRQNSLSSDGEASSGDSNCGSASKSSKASSFSSSSSCINGEYSPNIKNIGGAKGNHLWEFLCQLLRQSDYVPPKDKIIQWESREEGVFRILDSKEVAAQWGMHKGNKKMNYEKLSRALRWCRTYGFLATLPKDGKFPKKLCFRFGPRATSWRDFL